MKVFFNHIYEYKKGLRNLILHTTSKCFQLSIIEKLESENIAHIIYSAGKDRINIFFGSLECINVICLIGKKELSSYSAEEDFMLGIMLGYDKLKQCKRYILRKNRKS